MDGRNVYYQNKQSLINKNMKIYEFPPKQADKRPAQSDEKPAKPADNKKKEANGTGNAPTPKKKPTIWFHI